MINLPALFNDLHLLGTGIFMTVNPIAGEGKTESIIALLLVVTVCAMWIMGKEVPELLKMGITLIMGLYFGYQSGKNTSQ